MFQIAYPVDNKTSAIHSTLFGILATGWHRVCSIKIHTVLIGHELYRAKALQYMWFRQPE